MRRRDSRSRRTEHWMHVEGGLMHKKPAACGLPGSALCRRAYADVPMQTCLCRRDGAGSARALEPSRDAVYVDAAEAVTAQVGRCRAYGGGQLTGCAGLVA
jgi:hypothetical protein